MLGESRRRDGKRQRPHFHFSRLCGHEAEHILSRKKERIPKKKEENEGCYCKIKEKTRLLDEIRWLP
jgi:hypothetical protein|tara:strand:+ start:315 stop:515 length:201 start_codon:yes stop_codon:yes gene_type:complete